MPVLQQINDPAIDALDEETFAGLDCVEHGIVVLRGDDSWHARERGRIELPTCDDTRSLTISHDERKAPFVTDEAGDEQTDFLISLTDEDDYLACAWARVAPGSPLRGVGVDLCRSERFVPQEGRRDFTRLLLTDREREIAAGLDGTSEPVARASLFAAKEAAFKSCAAPLRRWYDAHDEELLFEVRNFRMEEPGLEQGTARNAAAQRAMDLMGIQEIRIHYTELDGMALVTAVAV